MKANKAFSGSFLPAGFYKMGTGLVILSLFLFTNLQAQETRGRSLADLQQRVQRPPAMRQQPPMVDNRQLRTGSNTRFDSRSALSRNPARSTTPVYSGDNPRAIRPTPPPANLSTTSAPAGSNRAAISRPYTPSRPQGTTSYGDDRRTSGNINSNNGYSKQPMNTRSYANRGGYRSRSYGTPVYSAYNPNWRYVYAPRRNSLFNSLPASYLSIHFGGFGYRYYDGIFYRPYNNVFRVVAPPRGIFISALPFGYRTLYVRDNPYYYYNGTYYNQQDNNKYVVVSPPVGAVVESIPDGYETITINGETYYEADGAQYKPVVQENGEIWYEVIKSNDE